MNMHHSFLKNDLNITTPEIDKMIDIAIGNGAIGSKIVDSGGGGSINNCLSDYVILFTSNFRRTNKIWC